MTTFPSSKTKGGKAPRKSKWSKGTAGNDGKTFGQKDNIPANSAGVRKGSLERQISRYGK